MNGGASAVRSPASFSTSATRATPTRWRALRRRRPIPITAAETHFMAGWIALRFLNDPATALTHFAHIDDGAVDPLTIARAQYWRGRAHEALGRAEEMRKEYEAAAAYPTTYYGQLARARLGHDDVVEVRQPPEPLDSSTSEVLRAAEMLYKTGEGNLAMAFVTDVGQDEQRSRRDLGRRQDHCALQGCPGDAAARQGRARPRHAHGPLRLPGHRRAALHRDRPPLDRCIVYAITRTESGFDPGDKSAAQAVGLMQVTPSAGRDTAKRFGVSYSWDKLVHDSVYNTQMGAAELSALLKDYRGSYVLTFAGYNAGRGRVEQWMAAHGDPRDPKVDAVDWVERIPFSETRNYVQRVMENLQVYRKRFGDPSATIEPNLHRAAMIGASGADGGPGARSDHGRADAAEQLSRNETEMEMAGLVPAIFFCRFSRTTIVAQPAHRVVRSNWRSSSLPRATAAASAALADFLPASACSISSSMTSRISTKEPSRRPRELSVGGWSMICSMPIAAPGVRS